MSEPCDLSARAVLSGFASKELSPVEVVRSCIDRINALNPVVNAVVALDEKRCWRTLDWQSSKSCLVIPEVYCMGFQ